MTIQDTTGLLNPFTYGRGYPQLIAVTTPATGSSASVPVAGSHQYRLVSAAFTLTASAGIANREPRIRFLDGDGNEWLRSVALAFTTASTTTVVQGFLGLATAYTGAGGEAMLPLPDLIIPAGYSIELGAGTLQAADTITAGTVLVEVFPIGGQGYPIGVGPAFPPFPT